LRVSYRPITDVWILARPKVKYYGAYPAGFLHRARALLGVSDYDPVLHVCAGRVRDYPYRGFGPNDRTVDLDPATEPDYLMDVREGLPAGPWLAVLIDRPYTVEDAARYVPGADTLPAINPLVKCALNVMPDGCRVGVLDYVWTQPPKDAKEVAVIGVGCGRNQRARWFTVFERVS
jgi:hypothetical protein